MNTAPVRRNFPARIVAAQVELSRVTAAYTAARLDRAAACDAGDAARFHAAQALCVKLNGRRERLARIVEKAARVDQANQRKRWAAWLAA